MGYLDFVLPAEWASYIVNGDDMALTTDDVLNIEDTLSTLGVKTGRCLTVSTNEFYTRYHDAVGVTSTNCLTYSFVAE